MDSCEKIIVVLIHFYTMHSYFMLVGSFNGYSLFCCCNQGISCKYFFFSYPGFCNLDHSFLHQFFPGRKFVFIISWNNLFAGCNNIAWSHQILKKEGEVKEKTEGGSHLPACCWHFVIKFTLKQQSAAFTHLTVD